MMNRRRLLLWLGIAAAFVVALWLVWPGDGIHRSKFLRIAEGMTEEQVDAIFGCPEGYYVSPNPPFFLPVGPIYYDEPPERPWRDAAKWKSWFWDDGYAQILFDKNGMVIAKFWHEYTYYDNRNLLERAWDKVNQLWAPNSPAPMTAPVRIIGPTRPSGQ